MSRVRRHALLGFSGISAVWVEGVRIRAPIRLDRYFLPPGAVRRFPIGTKLHFAQYRTGNQSRSAHTYGNRRPESASSKSRRTQRFYALNSRAAATASLPLRRCGALVARAYRVHSPSPHKPACDACRSRRFWLSLHGAIKCVACAAPTDLRLVEAWVLVRETGEGDDRWRIPSEILSLLHVTSSPQ